MYVSVSAALLLLPELELPEAPAEADVPDAITKAFVVSRILCYANYYFLFLERQHFLKLFL